jgi:hypothetical protein
LRPGCWKVREPRIQWGCVSCLRERKLLQTLASLAPTMPFLQLQYTKHNFNREAYALMQLHLQHAGRLISTSRRLQVEIQSRNVDGCELTHHHRHSWGWIWSAGKEGGRTRMWNGVGGPGICCSWGRCPSDGQKEVSGKAAALPLLHCSCIPDLIPAAKFGDT